MRRPLVLLAVMVVTGAATQWLASDDESRQALAVPTVAPKAGENPPAHRPNEPRTALNFDKLKRPPFEAGATDPFASLDWMPHETTAPTRPSRRAAPPLPFTFFGRMLEQGRTVVFLEQGLRTLSVGAGDTIDGTYRVDEIAPETIVFTYLPLNEKQTLAIGAMN